MGRRGRPRKSGAREKSGRIQRSAIKDQEIETMRGVLEQRCRAMSLRPTVENLRKMRGPEFSTFAGRLVAKHARPDEYEQLLDAAQDVFSTIIAYRRAIDAPRSTPAPSGIFASAIPAPGYVAPSSPGDDPEFVLRCTNNYMRLRQILGSEGPDVPGAVIEAVMADVEPRSIAHFLTGLRAVVAKRRG